MKQKKVYKKILIGVGLVFALFILANSPYLWATIKGWLRKPVQIQFQDSGLTEPTMTANTLIVESLNIEAPIIYVEENTEKVFQEALINGVVHYPGTARPGEYGNVYIFGHSSDYIWSKGNFKTIFAPLPNIKLQTKILVSDQSGKIYIYVVKESFATAANDGSVLEQGDRTKKILTLQTSYPVGTALKRWIVRAEAEP